MALASFYENDGDGTESEPEVIGPPSLVNQDSDDEVIPLSDSASAPPKAKQNTNSRYSTTYVLTFIVFIEIKKMK